jgi:hypothetical protein
LSLIVPAERGDYTRATFCQQLLFFKSEQAAMTFHAGHPEALLLSVAEAVMVGCLVAHSCTLEAT